MSYALASASVDCVVVGAGVAGLAAAAELRRHGRSVCLLEAGSRIGGRAWTERPGVLGGIAFDHGAQWLHSAERNPLVPLALSLGEDVHADMPWEDRMVIAGGPGGASRAAYEAAEARWRRAVTARLGGADTSLAEAAGEMAGDPWTPAIEFWEGAIIAAADADVLSLHDWAANELEGENFVCAGGLGMLLARCLGPAAGPVRLGAAVHAIEAEAGSVRVRSGLGDILAGAVIVTVSTGVLAAGGIAFRPVLPDRTLEAIDGLPMGLLTKVALRAAGAERLGLKPGSGVFRPVATRDAPGLSTIFWADGTDIATGFIGGRTAWGFAERPAEAAAFMRDELAGIFGEASRGVFQDQSLMTGWGADPAFLGAYAYARPGHAGARAALAEPVWDGRLSFAGEACAPGGFAGTVAGAYMAGVAAAQNAGGSLDLSRPCSAA